ncbi:MAG: heavy-metal-associated domain-containing protein [Ignavibacteriota bacterium]|jgi:copper chaperone|nr:MAG: heavy-metal-associated domain-containing protein [Ignavibacterium sp.]MBL1153904.1 copper chaperone [Ignavibacteriota bacterium]MCO6447830.1 heavy-metal-associated domain-containing protein [Ignavibacterium album]MCZ2269238.1 cation transporter [Ignavibacteriales bacterium]MDX9711160.1 cation transporter [Ignavibacteriaceae bacterium]
MEATFKIDGMSCNHCVMAVKKEIQKLDVESLDVKIGEASVKFDEKKVSESQIKEAITEAGYTVIQ